VFPRDCVLPRNQAGEFETRPYRNTGNAPFGIVKVFFPYLPFIGRYGSGSHETQPVKQHSQGGALGMGLLTGPAAVHYSLLVAK
jgi:hypothetical protein